MCCLWYVSSFLVVFPSDLLHQHPIASSGTLIVKTDPHTHSGSHCLAIHLQSRSQSSYYFNSYGLLPFIPSIQSFIKRNCIVWDYNAIQLQGPTSSLCCKYCCLFALYMAEDIHLENSSEYLLQRRPTRWCRICSSRNLDLYALYPAEESVMVLDLLGTYVHFLFSALLGTRPPLPIGCSTVFCDI